MKEFVDRIPAQGKTNRKKITYSDSSEEYVFIENADDPDTGNEGTSINRNNMMAMQGFQKNDTTITENADGTVTTIEETNGNNEVLKTIITENNDGTTTIVEKFPYNTAREITKTTIINALGTIISEVIS